MASATWDGIFDVNNFNDYYSSVMWELHNEIIELEEDIELNKEALIEKYTYLIKILNYYIEHMKSQVEECKRLFNLLGLNINEGIAEYMTAIKKEVNSIENELKKANAARRVMFIQETIEDYFMIEDDMLFYCEDLLEATKKKLDNISKFTKDTFREVFKEIIEETDRL